MFARMTKAQEFVVTKANALIQSSYKLTLNEQRIVLACVAQLDGRKVLLRDNLFTVTAVDYAETYGVDRKNAYSELEEAATTLGERWIRTHDGKTKTKFRWVYFVQYSAGEGKVTLGFSPSVAPYLTMLNKRFTSYELKNIAELRSSYSIRLYEFLMQFKKTGHFAVPLDDFKGWLELDDAYPRFVDLKRRVIDPAVRELQAKSNLLIEWRAVRKGKAVDRLEFTFSENPQEQLAL